MSLWGTWWLLLSQQRSRSALGRTPPQSELQREGRLAADKARREDPLRAEDPLGAESPLKAIVPEETEDRA